jgi:hypothetical protein
MMSLDFSENLTLPIECEIQTMHWQKSQVSIHCGILKTGSAKIYHGLISDDKTHDQCYVALAVEELLESYKHVYTDFRTIVIVSDNCTSQYKSAHHWYHLQELCDKHDL